MGAKIAFISILANIVLAGGKIVVGLISSSSAILAEGLHSFMDVFSSAVSFAGIKISKKPADEKHPYGHYKFEVLAGIVITLILLATGGGIIYEAYKSFLSPEKLEVSWLSLGVMIFSVAVNEAMARLKIYYGKKEGIISLISDGVHSRIDVFASLAVFLGLLLTHWWVLADSVLAFLIGLYIIKESFSLGKEAVDSLLDVSAGKEIEEKIKSIVKNQGIEIESLKTQKKGSAITANLEIKLPSNLKVEEATKVAESLRKNLMNNIENLIYVAIQIKSHNIETGFYKSFFGRGFGWQRRGKFKDKLEEAAARGPGGYCVCPKCGYKIIHQRGVPCSSLSCPNCNINLERQ